MVKPTDPFVAEKPTDKDLETVAAQLGRAPRDVSAVAHRCACGQVDVVQTPPRLADGKYIDTDKFLSLNSTAGISLEELEYQLNKVTSPFLNGKFLLDSENSKQVYVYPPFGEDNHIHIETIDNDHLS